MTRRREDILDDVNGAPAQDLEHSLGVHLGRVPGPEPTVLGKLLRGRLGLAPVFGEDVRSPDLEVTAHGAVGVE